MFSRTYLVVGGLDGAENRRACRAAELWERVGDGWQRGWTELLLFLQAPAEGDTHTGVGVTAECVNTRGERAHATEVTPDPLRSV